jgi:hypothetical protein
MKSTVKPIEMRITTMKVVLKIQEYCPWYPDVEGFRLRYEFGRTLQSLTDAFIGLEGNIIFHRTCTVNVQIY